MLYTKQELEDIGYKNVYIQKKDGDQVLFLLSASFLCKFGKAGNLTNSFLYGIMRVEK